MINCCVCPFHLDCKVETKVERVDTTAPGLPIHPTCRDITSPVVQADCPLKQAVELVKGGRIYNEA